MKGCVFSMACTNLRTYQKQKDYDLKNNKDRDRMYQRFSPEQKTMFHSIKENVYTFCESCAGSGKTLVSTAAMLDMLANDDIQKIVYLQKVSGRYLQNGFNPGTLEEKTKYLWDPFYDAMLKLGYSPYDVDSMIEDGLIVLTTDSTLRGVNFENVGLIIDEAQNCDAETLRMIFTRCNIECHVVLAGDRNQKDNKNVPVTKKGRMPHFIKYGRYMAIPSFGCICKLTRNFRGDFSQWAENFDINADYDSDIECE
jgi:phosphate starvation-inducible protein PhoH